MFERARSPLSAHILNSLMPLPPLNGQDFSNFAKELNFRHRKIIPYWSQANAEAESFIKTIQKAITTDHIPGLANKDCKVSAEIGNKNCKVFSGMIKRHHIRRRSHHVSCYSGGSFEPSLHSVCQQSRKDYMKSSRRR